ncbi:thiol-disulfide oxidoreductase DCC family protein [Kitasatospora sp. NPDC006697]|uniref:thiol-disulfide oxidoreductase DCC family protein n=1 Tax=Kitasatospora sp. NPDC006697 TaxID=3364020 RepID=UPI00369DFA93
MVIDTQHEAGAVLAYDGDCGFCQVAVAGIRKLAAPRTPAVPWQALPNRHTAAHVARLEREVLLLQDGVVHAGGADALIRFVESSPSRRYRVAAAVVGLPGVRILARRVYAVVSRNRHRIRTGAATCSVARS